jgi:hypothetical protein
VNFDFTPQLSAVAGNQALLVLSLCKKPHPFTVTGAAQVMDLD